MAFKGKKAPPFKSGGGKESPAEEKADKPMRGGKEGPADIKADKKRGK